MPKPAKDRDILRALASEVAEIAALPVQEERRRLWRALNALRPERPMVTVYQAPWNEIGIALECEDKECRDYEWQLRTTLYRCRHFDADYVTEPFIEVPKAVYSTGWGVEADVEYMETDPENVIRAQHYSNQFRTDADLDKIKSLTLTHDTSETARRQSVASELFDGIIETRLAGYDPGYMSLWDPISMWMNVEDALFAIIDRPEYVHEMLERMTRGYLSMLDQAETLDVLCETQQTTHWNHIGAQTDELPRPSYNPAHPRVRDLWCWGMAQMFSTVSPDIFAEFEVAYFKRLAERFGLVYYGCCEPLDDRIAQLRVIPNLRKISISPWANQARAAAAIGGDYVFSRKPNPAMLAGDAFHEERVRADLAETLRICREHDTPCELILKDVSTIAYDPSRLDRWTRIAMELVAR